MIPVIAGLAVRGALVGAFRVAAWGLRHPVMATGVGLGAASALDAVTDGASTEHVAAPLARLAGQGAAALAGGALNVGKELAGGALDAMGEAVERNGLYAGVIALAGLSLLTGGDLVRSAMLAGILTMAVKFAEERGVKLPGLDLGGLSGSFNRSMAGITAPEITPEFQEAAQPRPALPAPGV